MITWEWLAGFFDGEGCINLTYFNGYPSLRVSITQKNLPVLELVFKFMGAGRITKVRGAHAITIGKKSDVVRVLTSLLPHLVLRKSEAEIAIQLCGIGRGPGNRLSEVEDEKQTDLIAELEMAANRRKGEF